MSALTVKEIYRTGFRFFSKVLVFMQGVLFVRTGVWAWNTFVSETCLGNALAAVSFFISPHRRFADVPSN